MKYRSRIRIVHDILQIARSDGNDGAGKTEIMYRAFLSYAQMKEYLTVMTENNLLQHDIDAMRYRITEKGLSFLRVYNQVDNLTEKEEEPRDRQQVTI